MPDIRNFFKAASTSATQKRRREDGGGEAGPPIDAALLSTWPSRDGCFDDLEPDPKRRKQFVAALHMMNATKERLSQAPAVHTAATSPDFKKYTPLEKQVIELKAKHKALGCLLAFEVGYKFMFYGDDATVVAQELSIVAYPKNNFLVAGIPIERLRVHLRRLCDAGHKVGVIRQTETRALKAAATSGSSKLFTRELKAVFTKTTLIDDSLDETCGQNPSESSADFGMLDSHLISLSEFNVADADPELVLQLQEGTDGGLLRTRGDNTKTNAAGCCSGGACTPEHRDFAGSAASAENVRSAGRAECSPESPDVVIGMVAIDTATATIVHDCFLDGPGRPELEARLAHLQPQEILSPNARLRPAEHRRTSVPGYLAQRSDIGISDDTERLIKRLAAVGTGREWRIERRPATEWGYVTAVDRLCNFYQPDPTVATPQDHERTAAVLNFSRPVVGCLGALLGYLESFGLEAALRLTANFRPFRTRDTQGQTASEGSSCQVPSALVCRKPVTREQLQEVPYSERCLPAAADDTQVVTGSTQFVSDGASSSPPTHNPIVRGCPAVTEDAACHVGPNDSKAVEAEGDTDATNMNGPMEIDALTLSNLEILQRQGVDLMPVGLTSGMRVKGSLLWLMNRTRTAFGARQLRTWLLRPLRNRNAIEARQGAVAELHSYGDAGPPPTSAFYGVVALLGHPVQQIGMENSSKGCFGIPWHKPNSKAQPLPDLQRSLASLHYARMSPSTLSTLLHYLQQAAAALPADLQLDPSAATSPLLRELVTPPTILHRDDLLDGLCRCMAALQSPTMGDQSSAQRQYRFSRDGVRRVSSPSNSSGSTAFNSGTIPLGLSADCGATSTSADAIFNLEADWFCGQSASATMVATRRTILACRAEVTSAEAVLETLMQEEIEPALAQDSGFGAARYAPSGMEYKSVAGEEYLIELPQSRLTNKQRPVRIPSDWRRISATKSVCRFRPQSVETALAKLNQKREQLYVAAADGWRQFQAAIAAEYYDSWAKLVSSLATLDCLLSLAALAQLPGYCRPTLLPLYDDTDNAADMGTTDRRRAGQGSTQAAPAPVSLKVVAGRHPTAEALLPTGEAFVPNSIELCWPSAGSNDNEHSVDGMGAVIISGPNMGGKSSYLRQIALLVLMTQIGSYVPAEQLFLRGLFDGVYTRMGTATDSLVAGQSSFLVELQQTAAILARASRRSLVILDELGRGTATHDGTAIAAATLSYLFHRGIPTLFVTHYPLLSSMADPVTGELNNPHKTDASTNGEANRTKLGHMVARNFHMSFIADQSTSFHACKPAEEALGDPQPASQPSLTFLYKLAEGPARRSFGLNVGRLAQLPLSLLETAAVQAQRLEDIVNRARRRVLLVRFVEAADKSNGVTRDALLLDVQQSVRQQKH